MLHKISALNTADKRYHYIYISMVCNVNLVCNVSLASYVLCYVSLVSVSCFGNMPTWNILVLAMRPRGISLFW